MSIKKSYADIVEFLQSNSKKKVSSIMEEVLLMAESKKQSTTHLIVDDKVIAIFCYYHKQWEIVADVPYGSKANTVTKLNTMCKVGNSKWTKKQRDAKTAITKLVDDVSNSIIEPSDIKDAKLEIETVRLAMDTTDMPIGYANEELVWEVLLNPKDFGEDGKFGTE